MSDYIAVALEAGTESAKVDFKRQFDPTSTPEWLELLKDIVALANSGGGAVVIGVADDGAPSQVDVSSLFAIDPAEVTDFCERTRSGLTDSGTDRTVLLWRGRSQLPSVHPSRGKALLPEGLHAGSESDLRLVDGAGLMLELEG